MGDDLGTVVALAPFLDSGDLAQMLRERIDETSEVPDGLLTAPRALSRKRRPGGARAPPDAAARPASPSDVA